MDRISAVSKCVIALACLVPGAVTAFSQDSAARRREIVVHFERAQAALGSGKPDEAVREFGAVLAADPNNVEATANLGVIAFVRGDYTTARGHFRRVLGLQPSLVKAQAMLGMCEKRLGNARGARPLLEKSFPLIRETKLRTQVGLDLVELDYRDGDIIKTAGVLQTLQETDPANLDVLYAAHRIYSSLAAHAVDGIALTNPGSARMHQVMAQHLVNSGDLPGAIAQYQAALKLDPNVSGGHFELGEAILQNSKSEAAWDEAQKEFEAAVAANPADPKPECWLGYVRATRQDFKGALEHYTRALELDPDEIDAQLGMAKVLAAMDQPEKALPHLLAAVRSDPLNATAHYRLSAVYRQLARPADAGREAAAYREIRDRRKRMMDVYQQMHRSPASAQLMDSDVPQ